VDGGADNRQQLVDRAAKTWTGQLVDLGARNTLLYYRDLRAGTLDLGAAGVDPVALEQLLAGSAVRLSALYPSAEAVGDAAKRARGLAWRTSRRSTARHVSSSRTRRDSVLSCITTV